jgi:hypothetical protein
VDKLIITVSRDHAAAGQLVTDIATTNTPCTVTGFRWHLDHRNVDTTMPAQFGWALVVVKQGNTPQQLNLTGDGAPFYAAEQQVIAWGSGLLTDGSAAPPGTIGAASLVRQEGSTKTQRKLMQGDRLVLIMQVAGGSTNVLVRGGVQAICRF